MASAYAGIAHQPPGQAAIEYLPLEEVKVKAWVVDVSSRIVLSQTFSNPSDRPTGRAKYVFPLPANAAVCAFELELEDGTIIVGEVKDKEEAASAFVRATDEGRTAGLIERVTDDIFTISVGSIPALTKVTAHLTFVMDLLDEAARDHVRLQLPMSIAKRYGTPPAALNDASAANSRTRVHITVDIQTSDVIYAVRSPSHHDTILLQRYKTRSGRKSGRRMSAVWKSDQFLMGDFVVTVHAEGLDKPRCFAEVLSTGDGTSAEECTIAMQLTLVPKFQAPKIPSQEFIFVIDRSGSMSGPSIETAKRTLTMLLRLLPTAQTTFNIFSFGSKVTKLWPHSVGLNRTSLTEATSHVRVMGADYGGTETPSALQFAFGSRGLDRPAVAFLLTDGQIYGSDTLDPFVVVRTAIRDSPPHAPLRLFILGIGAEVSSDVCSNLARDGNGEYLFALSTEDILGKCARLLNAGRSKNIERIDVDWTHVVSSASSLQRSPPSLPTRTLPTGTPALAPPPSIQQAPHSLTKIFSGIRFTVFAITSLRTVPSSVRLLTKLQGVSEPLELVVDVSKVKPFRGSDEDSVVPMVHTLAARRLIMELDDKVGPIPSPAPDDALLVSEDELRRAGIVRLGLTYQLVSKYTSFVAVQQGNEHLRAKGYGRSDVGWSRSRLLQTHRNNRNKQEDVPEPAPTFLDNLVGGFSSVIASVFDFFGGGTQPPTTTTLFSQSQGRSNLPGAYALSDSGDSGASEESRGRGRGRNSSSAQRRSPSSQYSTDTFSTLSSLEGSSRSSIWSTSRSPTPQPRVRDPLDRPPSPEFVRDQTVQGSGGGGPTDTGGAAGLQNPTSSRSRVPVSQDAYDLFMQMDVDGCFAPSPLLTRLVGDVVLNKGDELGIDKRVWATVVAAAYLKKNLQDEPDLLELLSEKAREFVEALGGDAAQRFDEMVRDASAALAE